MNFKDSLKHRDFVITAQMNLVEAPDAESLIKQAQILQPVVDAVQLTDNSNTKLQMSSLAAAALLIPLGIDPIVHMASRDRNRIALGRDLVGAAAIGVNSILVRRGKKLQQSKTVEAQNVFDIPALKFMDYIQSLKQSDDDLISPDFLIGARANILNPEPDWTPTTLYRKCDAGVNFVQYPICFDMDTVRAYMARMVELKLTHRVKFIMTLSTLSSARAARRLRDNRNGARVPEPIIERLEQASDPESEGIEICAQLLRELASIPGISGANLMTTGRLASIPAAIEASGLRRT
jgi:methylenetetrahydrofolate reductase (NADPH)